MSSGEDSKAIVKYFSMLSDETRLKIIRCLAKKEMSVSDIHRKVRDVTLSAVSHQLRLMSDIDMVRSARKGRNRYFRLSDKYCWCGLRTSLDYFKKEKRCRHCSDKLNKGFPLLED